MAARAPNRATPITLPVCRAVSRLARYPFFLLVGAGPHPARGQRRARSGVACSGRVRRHRLSRQDTRGVPAWNIGRAAPTVSSTRSGSPSETSVTGWTTKCVHDPASVASPTETSKVLDHFRTDLPGGSGSPPPVPPSNVRLNRLDRYTEMARADGCCSLRLMPPSGPVSQLPRPSGSEVRDLKEARF